MLVLSLAWVMVRFWFHHSRRHFGSYLVVLRYSPYTRALTEVIRSGELGRLINVVHVEPVGFYHFAHSYVRGNWAKEQDSCFSLMTKGCQ